MRTRTSVAAAAVGVLLLVGGGGELAFAATKQSSPAAPARPASAERIVAQAGLPFYAKATSGRAELITGTWDGGCRSLPGGIWEHSQRTLYGHVLDWTWTDYANNSTAPDCVDNPVDVIHAVQAFASDGVAVPFSWSDSNGDPAPAPPGLGSVHQALGLTAVVSSATETPLTPGRAADLDQQSACGIDHWSAGLSTDILDCFTGGLDLTPFKASLLIDDTSVPGEIVIYDGLGNPSTTSYPALMPDDVAHHRDTGSGTP